MMNQYATRTTETYDDAPLFGPERELQAEVRNLMALVGELTITLVVQGAYLSAARHRRDLPTEHDVDESISVVADNVPEHVADGLWDARDALLARFRTGNVLAY